MTTYTINETKPGEWQLYETTGNRTMLLETTTTRDRAQRALERWQARDAIMDATEELMDELTTKYAHLLPAPEVKTIMRDQI